MDYEPEIEEHHIHTVRAALCSAQGAGLKYLSKGYVRYETPTDHTVGVVFRDDSAGSLNPQTTKYLAAGWCTTMAEVDCSGSRRNPLVSRTPTFSSG
jgi:hypothetical protein